MFIESICIWLDVGDAARDDEICDQLTGGLRALAGSWIAGGPPLPAPPRR